MSLLRLIPCVFIIFPYTNFAQHIQVNNARSAGMGNVCVFLSGENQHFSNPASLAKNTYASAAVHFEDTYFSSLFQSKAINLTIPTNQGVVNSYFILSGTKNLYYTQNAFSYARTLTPNTQAGIELGYRQIIFPKEYGRLGKVFASGGIIINPVEKFVLGCYLINPWEVLQPISNNEFLHNGIYLGAAYYTENTIVGLQFYKSTYEKQQISAGIEQSIFSSVWLRSGIKHNTYTQYHFGLGYKINKSMLDFAIATHPFIGITPYVTISYLFR
jgi:hypothetical protein